MILYMSTRDFKISSVPEPSWADIWPGMYDRFKVSKLKQQAIERAYISALTDIWILDKKLVKENVTGVAHNHYLRMLNPSQYYRMSGVHEARHRNGKPPLFNVLGEPDFANFEKAWVSISRYVFDY